MIFTQPEKRMRIDLVKVDIDELEKEILAYYGESIRIPRDATSIYLDSNPESSDYGFDYYGDICTGLIYYDGTEQFLNSSIIALIKGL